MRPTDLFHISIVVSHLEEAMVHLTSLVGMQWLPVVETQAPIRDPADGSTRSVPLRFVYSVDSPQIELIEEAAGTVWITNSHSNLHHIGFRSSNLAADAEELQRRLCPVEIGGFLDDTAPHLYTYHRDPLGIRIELVDDALRPGGKGG